QPGELTRRVRPYLRLLTRDGHICRGELRLLLRAIASTHCGELGRGGRPPPGGRDPARAHAFFDARRVLAAVRPRPRVAQRGTGAARRGAGAWRGGASRGRAEPGG